jgi:type I restriction enzyme M protein
VIDNFDFDHTITKLDEAGLLFQALERFKKVDLHDGKIDNATMDMIFEELIRKFNEALNDNPGEDPPGGGAGDGGSDTGRR